MSFEAGDLVILKNWSTPGSRGEIKDVLALIIEEVENEDPDDTYGAHGARIRFYEVFVDGCKHTMSDLGMGSTEQY